jgi:hypothetical protein
MQAKDQLTDATLTTTLIAAGLTAEELTALKDKMFSGGHKFFTAGQALGDSALYLHRSGHLGISSPCWEILWDTRSPLMDAMDELYAIMNEVGSLRAPVSA